MKPLNLKQVFELNICDAEYKHNITDKQFEKHFLIKSIDLHKRLNLDSLIGDVNHSKKYIFIKGKKGTGKSTYIHFFTKEKSYRKKYHFDIINMNEYCSTYLDKDKIIKNIGNKILELLKNNANNNHFKSNLNTINEKQEEYKADYLSIFNLFSNKNGGKHEKLLLKDCIDYVLKGDDYKSDLEKDFFEHTYDKKIEVSFLIVMYLFLKIISLIEKKKKIVFCLDNLDALSQAFLVKRLFVVLTNIDNPFSNIMKGCFDFDVNDKVHYIIMLRNINMSYVENHGQEYWDKIEKRKEILEFNDTSDIDEIINKRLNYIRNKSKNLKEKDETELIALLMSKSKNDNIISCLFDNSKREIMNMLLGIVPNFNLSEVENIKVIEGVRGILLYKVLELQKNNRFLKANYIFSTEINAFDKGECSPVRMLMSLFLSCIESDTNTTIKLIEICRRIKRQKNKYNIKQKDLINFIENFYYESQDTSLLVIGKADNVSSDGNYSKNDIVNAIKNYFKTDKENFLLGYEVELHDAIKAYIRNVFIHYEFFNFSKEDSVVKKPLFNTIKKDDTNNRYEFEIQISEMYEYIKSQITKMDDYFCDNFCNNKSNCNICYNENVKPYINNTGFTYKKGTVHSIRIISSIINYLDKFREHLFNVLKERGDMEELKKTQLFMLDKIEQFRKLFNDKKIKDYSKKKTEDFKRIRTNISNMKRQVMDKPIQSLAEFQKITVDE